MISANQNIDLIFRKLVFGDINSGAGRWSSSEILMASGEELASLISISKAECDDTKPYFLPKNQHSSIGLASFLV